MPSGGRLLLLAALSAVTLAATGGTAAAIPPHAIGWNPEDGPPPMAAEHPGGPGHLPPGSREHEARERAELTDVEGGIADVAAFGNFAYLNKFSPECVSNGGSGTGRRDRRHLQPKNPHNVGFIPAHQNSYVGEGIHVVRADTPSFKGDILIHNNETCNATEFAPSGASLWDVTNPTEPAAAVAQLRRHDSGGRRARPTTRRTARSCSSSAACCREARTGSSRRCRTTRTSRTSTSSTSRTRAPR